MQTTNDTLWATNSFSKLLVHLNTSLSSYQDFPRNITKALKSIGEFSQHDRVHIIEIHNDMTFSIAYEWNKKEAGPTPEKWKHADIIQNSPLEEQLSTHNYIMLRHEEEANVEIEHLLEEQNCQQMLLLPLFESGSHFAFISFLQCLQTHHWTEEEIQTLCQLSSIIATRLNNYRLTHRMLHHLQKYHQQKISFLLHYNRLKQIHTEMSPTWENVKKSNPHLSELSAIENHITQITKICRSLVEK